MTRQRLQAAVDTILWEDWDPIGVREMGGPSDEYQSYVPKVVALIASGASETELADHLDAIASDHIGIDDRISAERAAKKLAMLR